jgi:hypothetical protein
LKIYTILDFTWFFSPLLWVYYTSKCLSNHSRLRNRVYVEMEAWFVYQKWCILLASHEFYILFKIVFYRLYWNPVRSGGSIQDWNQADLKKTGKEKTRYNPAGWSGCMSFISCLKLYSNHSIETQPGPAGQLRTGTKPVWKKQGKKKPGITRRVDPVANSLTFVFFTKITLFWLKKLTRPTWWPGQNPEPWPWTGFWNYDSNCIFKYFFNFKLNFLIIMMWS